MSTLNCVVEHVTYHNEENGYSVLRCSLPDRYDEELFTVIAYMPEVHVGSVFALEGTWKEHNRYGTQFVAEKWTEKIPATTFGMEKYLGSGLIKGIGPGYAKKIVSHFGLETFDILEYAPERLLEVPKLGKKRLDRIVESWKEQRDIKDLMLFVQQYDISPNLALKIYKTYKADSIKVLQKNPYKLADDIWGVGFLKADKIAKSMGFEDNDPRRLKSGLSFAMSQLGNAGHCFAYQEQLLEEAVKLLDADAETLRPILGTMIVEKRLVSDENDNILYLPQIYKAETGCAMKLSQLLISDRGYVLNPDTVIDELQSSSEIVYDSVQVQAIRTAISSKVMVLTGGPGTGKTTTTLGIISAYKAAHKDILLAAPTGRAAKRLSEATNMPAKTIHRLLEFQSPGGYNRNEQRPLEGDVLIVDECSMVDIILMYNLLKAIPKEMTLIMVGDIDQLPSVGAGNVLKDIINSGVVPVVRLTRIFRQAQGSKIIMNAHQINEGHKIDISNGYDTDFYFVPRETPEEIAALIMSYCSENVPMYYNLDPITDIQVLAPMRKGVCGTFELNRKLQQALNPETRCFKFGETEYRLHDKVMQIRNNYDKGVFNGDIGYISEINTEDHTMTVVFDNRRAVYEREDFNELVLAYASTIHKSQGSEYPVVIIPISYSHYIMLQRNLLYTGVTRAKKICILIGQEDALGYAIRNYKVSMRNTRLASRIKEAYVVALKFAKEYGDAEIDF